MPDGQDPQAPVMPSPLPPGLAQSIAALTGGMGIPQIPSPSGPLPSSNPVQIGAQVGGAVQGMNAQDPGIQSALQASGQGQSLIGERDKAALGTYQDQVLPHLMQAAEIAKHMPQLPDQTTTGHGFLGDLGHILRNIMFASAPGQAFYQQRYLNPIERQRTQLAQQIQEAQAGTTSQMALQQPMEAGATEAARPYAGIGMMQSGGARQMEAFGGLTKAQMEAYMAPIMAQLKAGALKIDMAKQFIAPMIEAGAREYAADRGLDAAKVLAAANQGMANMKSAEDIEKAFDMSSWFSNLFGFPLTPEAPQTPGGAPAQGGPAVHNNPPNPPRAQAPQHGNPNAPPYAGAVKGYGPQGYGWYPAGTKVSQTKPHRK